MQKKYKKSFWLPALLFVYMTGMAVYFLPRNHDMAATEKFVTLGVGYLIVFLLWWSLRTKERMAERRQNDIEKNENN